MSTATKKMNGTNTKVTDVKSKKNVTGTIDAGSVIAKINKSAKKINDATKRIEDAKNRKSKRNVAKSVKSEIKTEQKNIKQAIEELSYNIPVETMVKEAMSKINKLTLTDYEEKVDHMEIKVCVNTDLLVIKDGKVVKDLVELELNGVPVRTYYASLRNFICYTTRGNSRSMKRGSKLSDTAISYLKSILTECEEVVWNSTKFNLLCDSKRLEVRDDGVYLVLDGDIQIRDGGNRAVTLEILRRFIESEEYYGLYKMLDNAYQEFAVRERNTYHNDIELSNANTNQNNSCPHKLVEKVRTYGALDDIAKFCGKNGKHIVTREYEVDENNNIFLSSDFIEKTAGAYDDNKYYSENSKNKKIDIYDENDKSKKIGDVQASAIKTYFNKTTVNEIVRMCKAGKFNSTEYFGYIKDLGEVLVDLHIFMENEFLDMVRNLVLAKPNIFKEDYIKAIVKKYKKEGNMIWTQSMRTYINIALTALVAKDANGKRYFRVNPVEVLKNEHFLCRLLRKLYTETTGKTTGKISSVDSRDNEVAENIYVEAMLLYSEYYDINFDA